ncbi:MAG: 50S ribosomal protein L10 [Thermodesulfobacteriota bacterium]
MRRTEKEEYVKDLQEKLDRSGATFIAEYRGIKAVEMTDFRKSMRDASTDFKVVRNTLAMRAIEGRDEEGLGEFMDRPVALAFSYKDAALSAKTLIAFAKDHKELKPLAVIMGGKVAGPEDIESLATLPSREVLLGKLLGSLSSPASNLVGVLGGVQRKFLFALKAIADNKSA